MELSLANGVFFNLALIQCRAGFMFIGSVPVASPSLLIKGKGSDQRFRSCLTGIY